MLTAFRVLTGLVEQLLALPLTIGRFIVSALIFNPKLGKLRYVVGAAAVYGVFAVLLVYVFAPIRGLTGEVWAGDKLIYDSERWLATAIYDRDGGFVGTFDAALDSKRDVNTTDRAIELADSGYIANPDHKSIPVQTTPEYYWRCLVYHEDRNIGTWLNPYGIDLLGVLKIPYSTLRRTLSTGRPSIGVGGSTLSMQLSRVIYNTPPHASESAFEKLRRKFGEWWDAPVIYRTLTRGGNDELLRQWAANHLWLAQRTGGAPLHGVEMASRIVFGKTASELSVAEQFVLASAVNKPIILLEGSVKLNAVRLDRWRYIIDVRARKCASELLLDPATQKAVWFELTQIANGPPDPQVKPGLQKALEEVAPESAKAAQANPVLRANVLIPAARYGVREEMKVAYGFAWRNYVRGVTLTLDVAANRRFQVRVKAKLAELQKTYAGQIDPGFTLDVSLMKDDPDREMPNVVIAAADANGEIVRYYEAMDLAAYYGSPVARDAATGRYDAARETRAIASVGKMVAAIALANQGRDTPESPYFDDAAPASGLETCRKGGGKGMRTARVAFACSLSRPVEWRAAKLGQEPFRRLIDGFGLTMPPKDAAGFGVPPSTAAVRGLVTASPRKVHQMAGVVLAALTGRGGKAVRAPTLVRDFDRGALEGFGRDRDELPGIVPNTLIKASAHELLRTLLSAPLCTASGKQRIGTLKSISDWCAERKPGLRLHFAKTGTSVTLDPDATVDAWAAGGLQFASGKAYTYVVVIGTGNARRPWARMLHAAQIAAPLVEVLLEELAADAKSAPTLAAKSKTAG